MNTGVPEYRNTGTHEYGVPEYRNTGLGIVVTLDYRHKLKGWT